MSKENTKKFRGSRTCGGGTHKNRRGGGNRGGRGNAGGCKHHFIRAFKRGLTYGKHGFNNPVTRKKNIVNVGEIDEAVSQLIEEGIAENKDDGVHIDLTGIGIEKVLGGGKVAKPLFVTAQEFSSSAIQKLKDASGNAIVLSEVTE